MKKVKDEGRRRELEKRRVERDKESHRRREVDDVFEKLELEEAQRREAWEIKMKKKRGEEEARRQNWDSWDAVRKKEEEMDGSELTKTPSRLSLTISASSGSLQENIHNDYDNGNAALKPSASMGSILAPPMLQTPGAFHLPPIPPPFDEPYGYGDSNNDNYNNNNHHNNHQYVEVNLNGY